MSDIAIPALSQAQAGRSLFPPRSRFDGISRNKTVEMGLKGGVAYDSSTGLMAATRGFQDTYPDPDRGVTLPVEALMTVPHSYIAARQTQDAYKRYKVLNKVKDPTLQDTEGRNLEAANMAKLGSVGLWSLTTIPGRPLSLAAAVKNIEVSQAAPTLLGRVTFWLGSLGGGFFAAFYGLMLALCGYKLGKAIYWRAKMDHEFLESKVKKVELADIDAPSEELKDVALTQGALWLKRSFKEMAKEGVMENPKLSKEKRKEMSELYFTEHAGDLAAELAEKYKDAWTECLAAKGGRVVEAFGLILRKEFAEAKQKQELTRMFGGELTEELLTKGATVEMVEKAKSALNFEIPKQAFYFLLAGAGVAMMVLSFLPSLACQTASAAIYGITSLIGALLDGKDFLEWWKNGDVGKFDKTMAVIGLTVALISIAGLLIVATMFTGPTPWVVLALVAQTIWAFSMAASLHKIATHDEYKPTIKSLHAMLGYVIGDEKARAIFKRLPKEDRDLMHKMFPKNIEKMSEGDIKYVVDRLYDARLKKKHKDCLRRKEELRSYIDRVRIVAP